VQDARTNNDTDESAGLRGETMIYCLQWRIEGQATGAAAQGSEGTKGGGTKDGGESKNNANLHNEKYVGAHSENLAQGTRNHRSASDCLGPIALSHDECGSASL